MMTLEWFRTFSRSFVQILTKYLQKHFCITKFEIYKVSAHVQTTISWYHSQFNEQVSHGKEENLLIHAKVWTWTLKMTCITLGIHFGKQSCLITSSIWRGSFFWKQFLFHKLNRWQNCGIIHHHLCQGFSLVLISFSYHV